MTASHLAALVLEVWRASGARTEERRENLLMFYGQSYYGPFPYWTREQLELVADARLLTRQRTRIDELRY